MPTHTKLIKQAVIRRLEKRAVPGGGKLIMGALKFLSPVARNQAGKLAVKNTAAHMALGLGATMGASSLLGGMGGGQQPQANLQQFNTDPLLAGMTQSQYMNTLSPPPYIAGGYSPFKDPSSAMFKGQ